MYALRYNPATERFDCYEDKHIVHTLTCGTRFNLYSDDEGTLVAGKVEYHNGYYFIDTQGYVTYFYNGMQGTLS